jgi:hypothetical protein
MSEFQRFYPFRQLHALTHLQPCNRNRNRLRFGADRQRGKFRFFLLGALKKFLCDELDKSMALKRGGCWVANPPQRAITVYTPDGALKTFVEGQVKDPATGLTADIDAVVS